MARIIRAVIDSESDQASGYALLGADELAQTFMVSTRLKALSRQVETLPITQSRTALLVGRWQSDGRTRDPGTSATTAAQGAKGNGRSL